MSETLMDFINTDNLKAIKNDYEFRCKNFYDKYNLIIKEDIKKQMESCNLKQFWLEPRWVFKCSFLSSDIMILDPDYPENAFKAVRSFMQKCISELNGIFVDMQMLDQNDDRIIIEVMIENPIK